MEAVRDVLQDLQLAGPHPPVQLLERLQDRLGEERQEEALHPQLARDDLPQVAHRRRLVLLVVAGHHAAGHDPAERLHVHEHRVQRRPAHVVVVQVHPIRTCLSHRRREIGHRAVVDHLLEAQAALDHGGLFGRADKADHAAPPQARDLPGDAAHTTGGGADHHGLAGLDPPDVVQADIGRGARSTQGADVVREGHPRLGREAVEQQGVVADEDVVVPVVEAVEDLPLLVAGMVGPDDAPHGRALDRLADPDRRHVGLLAVESRTDGRLDGEVEVADEDLPDARLGHLDGNDLEVVRLRDVCRPRAQHDTAVVIGSSPLDMSRREMYT